MRGRQGCMLGITFLLLVCEVAISQLCKSFIIQVDGFHTLFIFMRLALLPFETAPSSLDTCGSPPAPSSSSSSAQPSSILPAESHPETSPGTHPATCGSPVPDEPHAPLPIHTAASSFNQNQVCSPIIAPLELNCGVSYAKGRIGAFAKFISHVLLASVSVSYLLNLVGHSQKPHHGAQESGMVQYAVLLVTVAAVSLLHKMLVLWLYWDKLQEERTSASRLTDTESHVEVNHKVLAAEETQAPAESRRVLNGVNKVRSSADNSLPNGALVLCNPGASSIPETDSQSPPPQPEVLLHAAAPPDSQSPEATNTQNALNPFPVGMSLHHTESRELGSKQSSLCLLSFLLVIQDLFTCVLALINSLVVLLLVVGSQSLSSFGVCDFLFDLDLGLSLLALITLIAIAMPRVHKYGLLLLQATPPHISVFYLRNRISAVPGVLSVHELHVWRLTQSFIVATVHVQCCAGFPANRCADLMLGVTKVLQSVGVSCCTVQPELVSCSGCCADSAHSPPLPACSLACGKACAGHMCCSLLEQEDSRTVAAPLDGKTKEEPQSLVIENTFH